MWSSTSVLSHWYLLLLPRPVLTHTRISCLSQKDKSTLLSMLILLQETPLILKWDTRPSYVHCLLINCIGAMRTTWHKSTGVNTPWTCLTISEWWSMIPMYLFVFTQPLPSNPSAPSPYSATVSSNTTTISKADLFKKGVKCDKSHYKPFKNKCYWDNWLCGFKATARTHDLANILNSSFIPSNVEEQELFDKQQKFMYSILKEHLLTDMGKTLVSQYENTFDAQKIFADLEYHMKNCTLSTIATSKLLSDITSLWMHTAKWNGTYQSFVLNWKDKVCKYNGLADQSQHLTSDILKTMLQNLVMASRLSMTSRSKNKWILHAEIYLWTTKTTLYLLSMLVIFLINQMSSTLGQSNSWFTNPSWTSLMTITGFQSTNMTLDMTTCTTIYARWIQWHDRWRNQGQPNKLEFRTLCQLWYMELFLWQQQRTLESHEPNCLRTSLTTLSRTTNHWMVHNPRMSPSRPMSQELSDIVLQNIQR